MMMIRIKFWTKLRTRIFFNHNTNKVFASLTLSSEQEEQEDQQNDDDQNYPQTPVDDDSYQSEDDQQDQTYQEDEIQTTNNVDDQQQVDDENAKVAAGDLKREFENFKIKYSRQYKPQEQNFKFSVFSANYRKVRRHNLNSFNSYRLQINQFADLNIKQFRYSRLMKNLGSEPPVRGPKIKAPANFKPSPVNWIQDITSPRDQGQCAASYAFALTSTIQGLYFIKNKNRILAFSEQHLIDCGQMTGQKCGGCLGRWPAACAQYYKEKGVAIGEQYPYKGTHYRCNLSVRTCKYIHPKNPFREVQTVKDLSFALKSGPVSVVLDATAWDPLYKEGVFTGCSNEASEYNHAVTVVGLDRRGVWTLRNSWGSDWGENGHMRLASGNSCGIADWGIVPRLA